VQAFAAARLQARSADNVDGILWLKAIVNAAINPLTAIHRVPNGRLLSDAALLAQMKSVCREAVLVARAERVTLPTEDVWATVESVARTTSANHSSMLQSVQRGRRTEIDAIT